MKGDKAMLVGVKGTIKRGNELGARLEAGEHCKIVEADGVRLRVESLENDAHAWSIQWDNFNPKGVVNKRRFAALRKEWNK
jgi:hypothetical protein